MTMNIALVDTAVETASANQSEEFDMQTISERELADNIVNSAVESVRSVLISKEESEGHSKPEGWTLIVKLTWRGEEQLLITQRKAIKTWLVLDRLVTHLQNQGLPIEEVQTTTRFNEQNTLMKAETIFKLRKHQNGNNRQN